MAWTERQHAILAEMGLRLWSAPAEADAGNEATLDLTLDAQAPVPDAVAVAAPTALVSTVADIQRRPAVSAEPGVAARAPASPIARAKPVVDANNPVTQMDWPALRASVAGCTACSLCESRRQTVFGTGHTRAHWMIIGEAPGEQEDLQGEPFVGKAGQLLDRMLAAIGLARGGDEVDSSSDIDPATQVYIANVLKCRPPNNRNPLPEEVARCEPYLQRQVALVRPRIILAMGRFAVQSILRTQEPIGRLRGTVHHYEGVPVIVTYHPAYLLRNPLDKARSWEDLCLAASVLEGQPLEPT